MGKSFGRVVSGGLALVATTFAYADESGTYADFDLGRATYSYATDVKFPTATLSGADAHIKDSAWGLTVGYRFIPQLGAEIGYVKLGEGTVPVADKSGAGGAKGTANFSSGGPALALVGAVQIRDLEAFLKVGYLFAHADSSVAGSDGATKLNKRVTASTPAPVAGVGLRYAFNEHWHVKLELDHYDGVGDAETTGAVNINVATLGIGCRF